VEVLVFVFVDDGRKFAKNKDRVVDQYVFVIVFGIFQADVGVTPQSDVVPVVLKVICSIVTFALMKLGMYFIANFMTCSAQTLPQFGAAINI
jgi:hypothetical protein